MSKKGLNLIFNFVLQQLNFKISIQDESKRTGYQNKTFNSKITRLIGMWEKKMSFPIDSELDCVYSKWNL